jgi:large subunit ribosomal protein L22
MANAENNFQLEPSNLKIDSIMVDQGPTLKRWRARAFGRANQIQKKTSHITIVLGEKVEGLKAEAKSKKKVVDTPKQEKKVVSESQRAAKRIEKKGLRGLGSKLFRRKSI